MEILISVILACHKVHEYIDKCIQSILSQTEKRVEVLIVFDSNNKSDLKIMRERYSSTCHIVEGPGNTPSIRWNIGLDQAKGKYIFFIDSDDFLMRDDTFSTMIECIEKSGADMVKAGFNFFDGEKYTDGEIFKISGDHMLTGFDAMKQHLAQFQWLAVWNVLYRRDFIGEERFEETWTVDADTRFNFHLLLRKPNIYIKNDFISYAYRINPTSASRVKSVYKYESAIENLKEKRRVLEKGFPELEDDLHICLFKTWQMILQGLTMIGGKKAKSVYKVGRKEYVSLGKLRPKDQFNKSEKKRDRMIRTNLLWPVRRFKNGLKRILKIDRIN